MLKAKVKANYGAALKVVEGRGAKGEGRGI